MTVVDWLQAESAKAEATTHTGSKPDNLMSAS